MVRIFLIHPDCQCGLFHVRLPFGSRIRDLYSETKNRQPASGGGFVIREVFIFEALGASHIERVSPIEHRGWLQQLGCYSPV